MSPRFGSREAPSRLARSAGQVESPGTAEEGALLYFAYDANMEPTRLGAVAPGARFCFIAHLPEWRLHFPIPNGDGGLPSVRPQSGNTVWGAVFAMEEPELKALNARQAKEGRVAKTAQAMDREGHRHQVVVHVCESANGELHPDPFCLRAMVAGSRHWHLPAGWTASLEEHLGEV